MPGRRIPQRSPQTLPLGNSGTIITQLTQQVYEVSVGGKFSMDELAYYTGARLLLQGERVRMVWHQDQHLWEITGIGTATPDGGGGNGGASAFTTVEIVATGDDGIWTNTGNFAAGPIAILVGELGFTVSNAFFRFQNVAIEQGATVPPLRIEFVFEPGWSTPANIQIAAEDSDDAAAPTSHAEAEADWAARTSAEVAWPSPIAAGPLYITPELTTIVQEIVNRGSWASGNSILFMLLSSTGGSGSWWVQLGQYPLNPAKLVGFGVPDVDPTDPGTEALTFDISGALTVASHPKRIRIRFAGVISGVTATVGTAPIGADIILDVNLNGTTIFTTQANRPRIVDGTQDDFDVATPDVTVIAKGDILTVDVDQIGSGTAGSDLTLTVTISGGKK